MASALAHEFRTQRGAELSRLWRGSCSSQLPGHALTSGLDAKSYLSLARSWFRAQFLPLPKLQRLSCGRCIPRFLRSHPIFQGLVPALGVIGMVEDIQLRLQLC